MSSAMNDVQINRFVMAAFGFEAALGAGAIAAGFLLDIDPLETVRSMDNGWAKHGWAAVFGVAGTLPLLLGLLVVTRVQFEPFARLNRFVGERLVPLFAPLSVFELAAISVAAGFGEEALFRGLIQSGLAAAIEGTPGVVVALVLTSVLFGVCHWITPTYAILAALAGAYFGLLFVWSGHLLTPLVAHALYDFVALVYLSAAGDSPSPSGNQAAAAGDKK